MGRAERTAFMLAMLALAGGAGCRLVEHDPAVPTFTVAPRLFEVEITGFGELEAARTTPIEVPQRLPGPQRVVFLLDDGSPVEADDLIARLDDEYLATRIEQTRETLRVLDRQLEAKREELAKERRSAEASLAVLEQQLRDAESWAPRDPELFSRNEILEAELDRELLATRIELARARLERYTRRAEAEMEILRGKRRTQQVRLAQFEQALASRDVRAPHAGVFFRATNWRGEKMSVGSTVWSGTRLGELPDLDEMQARLHVLESEAAGLAPGLEVHVILDAHPDVRIAGTVSTVQPIANPIERDSPVKYFELTIDLERTDRALMNPHSQVLASIFVVRREGVVTVPNQALFHDADGTWVWVRSGRRFERRPVELGERSLSRTVVRSGLAPGDVVALAPPAGQAETG
ncbi:MAG: hypothetical protein Kow0062_18980 [Acidobacteriota bacterium]